MSTDGCWGEVRVMGWTERERDLEDCVVYRILKQQIPDIFLVQICRRKESSL